MSSRYSQLLRFEFLRAVTHCNPTCSDSSLPHSLRPTTTTTTHLVAGVYSDANRHIARFVAVVWPAGWLAGHHPPLSLSGVCGSGSRVLCRGQTSPVCVYACVCVPSWYMSASCGSFVWQAVRFLTRRRRNRSLRVAAAAAAATTSVVLSSWCSQVSKSLAHSLT